MKKISCKFEYELGDNKSSTDVFIDQLPHKDDKGDWLPLIVSYEDTSQQEDLNFILNKVVSKDYTRQYGIGKIITSDSAWSLEKLWAEQVNCGQLDFCNSDLMTVEITCRFSKANKEI